MTQATAVTDVLRLTSGTLATDNNPLTLLSTAAGSAYAVHAGGTTAGNVTVQRYVGGPATASYHHLSSPVQAAPVFDLATTGFTPKVNPAYNAIPTPTLPAASFPNVFFFDEARGGAANSSFTLGYASPASLGAVLTPGAGYSVAIGGGQTPDFVGALTSGNVSMSGLMATGNPATNAKAGWFLLGNPYPQPIDWDLATIPAGLDPTIYVWHSTGGTTGAYRLRTATTQVGNLTNGVLALGQAFFARVTGAGPVSFTFTNALRVENNAVALGRPATATAPLLRLNLTKVGAPAAQTDATFLTTAAAASVGFDAGLDALRPGRNVGVPTLATMIGGAEAAINSLPDAVLTSPAETVVELTAALPTPGAYTLSVGELTSFGATSVVLFDRLTSTRYDLTQQLTVTLTATRVNEVVTGRFALVLNGQRVTGTSDLAPLTPHLTVYPNPTAVGGAVQVAGCRAGAAVAVYDGAGRRVATGVADAAGVAELSIRNLAVGVYTVRADNGRTTRLMVE